jgi:hypothetical protein
MRRELLAAAVAIVLTTAILLGQLRGPSGADPIGGDHSPQGAAPSSGTASPGPEGSTSPPRAAGALVEDPGFEAGLGRWQPGQGTRLVRVTEARSGAWAASLAAEQSATPSMGLRQVQRLRLGKEYAVTVWLRAKVPGALVRVDLAEEQGGRRYAIDSAGAVLEGPDWEPLEVVHVTHQPGAVLSIQIAAVELPDGGQVLVDDLSVRTATAASLP